MCALVCAGFRAGDGVQIVQCAGVGALVVCGFVPAIVMGITLESYGIERGFVRLRAGCRGLSEVWRAAEQGTARGSARDGVRVVEMGVRLGLIVVWLRADFRLCRATWEGVVEESATWVGDLGGRFVVGSRVC